MFLCTCKDGIAKAINLDEVAEFVKSRKHCKLVTIHESLCEDNGLSILRDTIKRGLECVIIGGCPPKIHERLFREEMERAGAHPLLLEMVNLREQCAWVHTDNQLLATEKAKLLVAGSIERAKFFGEIKSITPKIMRFKQPIARRDLIRSLFRLFREYHVTARINKQTCAGVRGGCEHCIESCPFQAIHREEGLTVRDDLCHACGICSAACPLGAIQVPNYTDEQLVALLRGILADEEVKLSPKIVIFSCDQEGYLVADAAGAKGLLYPPNVLIVRVPCIGLISEVHVLKAFELGAAGVLLSGCSSSSCPYIKGNEVASETCGRVRKLLSAFGLPESVDIEENLGDPQNFVDSVQDFVKRISPIAHRLSQIRGDTPLGLTRREGLVNLFKSFSDKLGVTPTLHEYGNLYPFAEVKINAEKCSACGVCINRCPTKALKLLKKEKAIQLDFTYAWCINCSICEKICPEGAIKIDRVLDLRQLVKVSKQSLVKHTLVSCIKCGKPFVPSVALKATSKNIQEKSAATGKYLNFMRVCYECRTKALLEG